jgi:hypothetical protein
LAVVWILDRKPMPERVGPVWQRKAGQAPA